MTLLNIDKIYTKFRDIRESVWKNSSAGLTAWVKTKADEVRQFLFQVIHHYPAAGHAQKVALPGHRRNHQLEGAVVVNVIHLIAYGRAR